MKEDGNRLTDKSWLVLSCLFPPCTHLGKAGSVALLEEREKVSQDERPRAI